ncbi:TonB-dependent receptor [Thermobrachium celere DSM 8682]|uniref:TonB-dependent receptor n=1 Tax=Thermobrachium celere DSM 8682 TaxID=941824 RepID=R7RN22_9CLOT|nr:TonB-dependent receptor [Thermobrachium celere DSM 8682]
MFSNPIAHTITDVNGNYKIMIFDSRSCFKVFATSEGYNTSEFQNVFISDGQKIYLTFTLNKLLDKMSYVVGRVMFQDKPVDMCVVEIYSFYYGIFTLCERTVTDKNGLFFIDGILSGVYIIKLENNMFYYKNKICLRSGLNSINIIPYIKPYMMYGTISGVIVDCEGKRVKDALVVLQRKDGKLVKFTRTNSQGEYLFYNVERGEYSIIACAKN